MLLEIWRNIENHKGYQVSNLGRVRSIDRVVQRKDGVVTTYRGKVLTPGTSNSGYKYVALGSTSRSFFVHRLVAEAFCGQTDGRCQVDHIDEDKTNNCASNLRWVTPRENTHHSLHRRKDYDKSLWHNPRAKVVLEFAPNGGLVKTWLCAKLITLELGVNYSTLRTQLRKGDCQINSNQFRYATCN